MDFQRLFLFLIFAFSLIMVWDGWQRYQHPEPNIQAGAPTSKDLPKLQAVPAVTNPTQIATDIAPAVVPAANPGQSATASNPPLATGKTIHVKTDLLDVDINTLGGNIDRLAFLKQPDSLDRNKPLVLFQRGQGTHNYFAQSGLLGTGLPNHNSLFNAQQEQYELTGNEEQLQVRLSADLNTGVNVTKIFTFHKGSYLIDIAFEVENSGQQSLTASSYFQLIRDSVAPEGSLRFLPTYTGAAAYSEKEKFQKVPFADIDKNKVKYIKHADNGWIGILQHYFVAAWIPAENTVRENFTRKLDGGLYAVGVVLPAVTIAPGQKVEQGVQLYAGPTEATLDKIAPGLGLTVDYGWLTIIATPLFWVMSLFHHWTHNWGVAIILLTILIKLIFFPLSAASYRSMAKMRLVAPKLEKIKQQYADDREQLNRAMMELYKTEKINPLGGCLPVVIQIPVFIALYWSILSSVEMRYAPFFGWITDLSAADPYYILPTMMGISMFMQMHLNPKPPDPLQAKVMQIMPIAFSVMFFFFPAGLVLYSLVNNVLSIAQQWFITRSAQAESKGAAAKR
ncbi:MAG: membrane protein insertase YidC [Gallionella sp.]